MTYENYGSIDTLWACDWENDKFEGNMQFDEPNRDEVRIQFNRLKRIVWTIEQYVGIVKDLEHFVNPFASYAFFAVLVIIILFANMNYIVHYLISLLLVIMFYNHPLFTSYTREIF